MGKFLWYFPGASAAGAVDIPGLGLSDVMPAGAGAVQVSGGPDDGSGLLMAGGGGGTGYSRDAQTWRECDEGKFWVGYETDAPPGPADLKRDSFISGHDVMLEDGNRWTVAIALECLGGTKLPQTLCMKPDGTVAMEVVPKFLAVCRTAERMFNAIQENEGNYSIAFESDRDWMETSALALGVNYAVDPWTLGALGVITTENVSTIIEAMVDIPTYIEIKRLADETQKKNLASDASGIIAGSPEIQSQDSQPSDGSEPTPTD